MISGEKDYNDLEYVSESNISCYQLAVIVAQSLFSASIQHGFGLDAVKHISFESEKR